MFNWDMQQQTPFRLPRKRGGLPFGDDVWLYESDYIIDFEIPSHIQKIVLLEPPPPFKLIYANIYPSFITRVKPCDAHVCGCSATGKREREGGMIQSST